MFKLVPFLLVVTLACLASADSIGKTLQKGPFGTFSTFKGASIDGTPFEETFEGDVPFEDPVIMKLMLGESLDGVVSPKRASIPKPPPKRIPKPQNTVNGYDPNFKPPPMSFRISPQDKQKYDALSPGEEALLSKDKMVKLFPSTKESIEEYDRKYNIPAPPFEELNGPFEYKDETPPQQLNETDCVCKLGAQSRIVGGQVAKKNSIPWQVSLASPSNSHFCGGSIINSRYILTAAHCMDGQQPETVKVRVGLHQLDDDDLESKTYSVERIFVPPTWDTPSKPGDIAILKTKTPIEFSRGAVEPACLNTNHVEPYDKLMASGWGLTKGDVTSHRTGEKIEKGELSQVLKMADFYQDHIMCKNYLICTNSDKGNSNCQGDSGGPLHYTRKGRTSVEGLSSFETHAALPGEDSKQCTGSSGYSRLSYYKKWIETIVSDNYCSV